MQQDIKKVLQDYQEKEVPLSLNHASKFERLLLSEMHPKETKKKHYKWVSVAASVVLLISLTIKFYPTKKSTNVKDTETSSAQKEISLGSISPEFNTIETYYTNSINIEISELEVTEGNKEILDGYLKKLAELTKEYKLLTKELNTNGVNDVTIDALIRNLQLRLQLLQRLKKQLKQLNTKQNENQII